LATFIVTKVRKQLSDDSTHHHIAGVCVEGGGYYTRRQVVDSMLAGNHWKTSADGYEATIQATMFCPQGDCWATPYIETHRDSTEKDNLENLDPC
jgi:hypothetical protein